MRQSGFVQTLSLICAMVTMLILSSRPAAADIVVDLQDLKKPVTFYAVELLQQEELVVTIRNIHWAKQGEIGMYENATTAANPDSDMIAFRNVGPSARITFRSDPADLTFGPFHDFRRLWSEAQQGTTIPLTMDTNVAGVTIDVTIASDNEFSIYSDSLTLQVVPEPGTAALVTAGLVALVPLRRVARTTPPSRLVAQVSNRRGAPEPALSLSKVAHICHLLANVGRFASCPDFP